METDTQVESEVELDYPNVWGVKFFNDDFTPGEFVVAVLKTILFKNDAEAVAIMLEVHNKGQAVVGAYTKEIAFTKVAQVIQNAELQQHPLYVEAVIV